MPAALTYDSAHLTATLTPSSALAQGGYTAIEMIITMGLTGILSGAIFSSFLVLDRIQTA